MDNILTTVVIVTFNPNYDTLNRMALNLIDNNIEILIIDNAKTLIKVR